MEVYFSPAYRAISSVVFNLVFLFYIYQREDIGYPLWVKPYSAVSRQVSDHVGGGAAGLGGEFHISVGFPNIGE